MEVVKRNKRLCIVDGAGNVLYSPPDFIRHRIKDRNELEEIIRRVENGEPLIDAIMKFESVRNRRAMDQIVKGIQARYAVTLKYLAEH